EHDRAHPDQAVGADRAAMEDDIVADHAVRPDRQRKAWIGVQSGIVLDLRALPELDPFVVTTQHRAEPDTGIAFEPYFADERGGGRDPVLAGLWKFRAHSVEFIDHRCSALPHLCRSGHAKHRKLPTIRQAIRFGAPGKPLRQGAGPATTWQGMAG